MERILVIEDDRAVQRALRRLLEGEGYSVDFAGDGSTGVAMFHTAAPSAIVLDLRLPGMSGRDVCRQIKKEAPATPVIVLSATTDVMDKVLLLELGADDYVTKPFSPRELLARLRAVMRRSVRGSETKDVFSFDDVVVNSTRMEVTKGGSPVTLTAQEFRTLKFFLENAERVVSREELLKQVWGYQELISTRTIDNHILKLRQKLETEPAKPVHFHTVHGIGYKFVP